MHELLKNLNQWLFLVIYNSLGKLPLFALLFAFISCKEQILHNLDEGEANRLISRLHSSSLEVDKIRQADGKWGIAVDKGDMFTAIRYLDDARMFNDRGVRSTEGSSIITSRENQRFNFERSLSSEIEATLRNLTGVLAARVHLNLPEVDPILGHRISKTSGSGSVLLIAEDGLKISVEEIKSLVSAAAGVPQEAVMVVINIEERRNPSELQTVVLSTSTKGEENHKAFLMQEIFSSREIIGLLASISLLIGVVILFKAQRIRSSSISVLMKQRGNDVIPQNASF